jgi:cell division protein FtsZ
VDEAATRIREEVDQDANIIVGATFDEGLEGIIRVSVVATGIDHVATAAWPQGDTRIAELTQKLRADTQRIAAERVERFEPQPQARPAPAAASRHSVGQAAAAAVAAAVLPAGTTEDVTIRPITPKPSLFIEPVLAEPAPQEMPKAFIPPEPERAGRSPRMPRIEDLPIPAQNEIRARRGEVAESGPEKQRLSLLQRLAQVGLGRREGDASEQRPMPAMPPPLDRMPQRPPARGPDPVSEYAKRLPPAPAPQGLDMHGRQVPANHKPVEDDQLEIPAFLRRQAN